MKGLRRLLKEGRFTAYFMRDRRWVALSLCLLVAACLWLIAALDDPRGYTKEFVVQLDKPILPTQYRMTDLSDYPETIAVKVHTSGGSLFRYTLNHQGRKTYRVRPTIDTTLLMADGGQYLLRENELKRLLMTKPLRSVSKLDINPTSDISIYPEEVSFVYEPLSEGTADVLFGSQVDFGEHKNFSLADTISIIPSSVRVFGVKSDLDNLMSLGGLVVTDTIGISVEKPGRDTVRVAVLTPEGIEARPDSVDVVLATHELIYHSFSSSYIEVRNLPPGYELQLFPSTVRITYLVPKGEMDEQTVFDPGLYVDAHDVIISTQQTLMIRADDIPPQVEMIQIVPDRLDFVLSETH